MTEAVKIALIVAVAPTIAAIGALIISWRNGQKADHLAHVQNGLVLTVDGRLTQLLELTAASSEAKGVLKQQAQETVTHALITAREIAKEKE